ncbi:MAG: non-ribosomal peptide synthetase, partial [Thermoanaerobaculia bacterium]
MLRFTLIRIDADRHLLLFTSHHVLLDGWSIPILLGELMALYENGGNVDALPRVQPYADYLAWLARQDRDAALEYWRNALSGIEEPTRIAAPSELARVPERIGTQLSAEVTTRLHELARAHGLTLNTVVQGLWGVLLGRLTGRDDVVFGVTVSGRPADLPGVEQMVGLFINTLPLRVQLHPALRLSELLVRIQEEQVRSMAAQHIGLAEIQKAVGLGELFDTLVVFENYPLDRKIVSDPRANALHVLGADGRDATHYPLSLIVVPDEQLLLRLDYDPSRISAETAQSIAAQLASLLTAASQTPDAPLYRIGERPALPQQATEHAIPDVTIPELLHAQVLRTPDHIALVYGDESLTYTDLDARTNQLAHHLIRGGVGPESIVGVAMERSTELVIALLGIVKAGGAYLPLDPDYPDARLAQMLADAAPQFVITTQFLAHNQAEIDQAPSHAPTVALLPPHPAYVIYTSGSTGKPKGVPNTHQGLVNRILWMQDAYRLDAGDRVLQKTPYSFDVSVWEFFWPLVTGATLVVAPPGAHRDAAVLADLIESQRITTMHFVPSMLRAFVGHPASRKCASLRRVMCSGEALPGDLQAQFFARLPNAELHNLYGPTEAAIDATAWRCRVEDGDLTPPIGGPIWNMRGYVLDSGLEPVPPGVAGELYLSGIGLARGYHQRPALTAERFVADPHAVTPGARMYRTGDRALWRSDGTLEFLGRADQQVKIRGFRIEPGEIESALLALPGITQAAVVVRGNQLVAYVVGAQPDLDALRRQLPEYMVPSACVMLDALPLTQSGKLDRRALPEPRRESAAHRAPRTSAEAALCGIFAEVLALEKVGIGDNFFTLGGDSILSIQLVTRARKAGLELTPRDVFRHPTVEALAANVRVAVARPTWDADAAIGEVIPTPIMRSLLEHAGDRMDAFSQSMLLQIPENATEERLVSALQKLIDTHDV